MNDYSIWFWVGFVAFMLGMLALDLGVFHKKSHTVSIREAFIWTGVWATLATIFGGWIWMTHGHESGMEFYAGYLIELSLSADNVFVFSIIFSFFAVPAVYQHKVLLWGVLSALVLRFLMIWGGAALVVRFDWILYIFGVFLLFTGLKILLTGDDEDPDPESSFVVRFFRRVIPTSPGYDGDRFLTRVNGRRVATPLLLVLACVEVSDVIFAVDSIPAIFAITKKPFIIFTSNVFAIMGLRSLYFVLAGAVQKFHLLRVGLGIILSFIGAKMLLGHTSWAVPTSAALVVVVVVLAGSIAASLIWPKQDPPED